MFNLTCQELALFATAGLGAMQKPRELEALIEVVARGEPKRVLEIGVGKGGTAWCWSKIPSVETLILIDLPGGPWGGGPEREQIENIARNSKAHLHFIAGNSLNKSSYDAVTSTLAGEAIDFLHIDGDHSYAGVKSDFLTYEPLLRNGGIIAFHDICEHPPETHCEVKKFWDEIKETWPKDKVAEFLAEPGTWGGIGLLMK